MSWTSGPTLFIEILPALEKHIPDRGRRIHFASELLKLFVRYDMNVNDVDNSHPDVRAIMSHADIG